VATSPQNGATKKKSRPKRSSGRQRDFEALNQRRRRAAELFKRGKSQADAARELGVSREAVSQWYRAWQEGGPAALAGAGRAGRVPRLDDDQVAEIEKSLLAGAEANGYESDLWTLARVAEVIERLTGVLYSRSGTWDLLTYRMGWSRQRPARRALERDDEAIATWIKTDWPRIKKVPGADGRGSSSKTSPESRCCPR
jgi:transposase